MTTLDPYERWRQTRAAESPPDGFADRVMAAVRHADTRQKTQFAGRLAMIAWLAQRRRGAAFLIAGAAFLLRLAAAFAVFISS